MRKTKIVCTIGPASDSKDTLRQLIAAGLDVARLNFSHGSHEEHGRRIELIRQLSAELGKPVAILQDLCGPKIRIGTIAREPVALKSQDRFTLTTRPVPGSQSEVSVSYPDLPKEVRSGDTILLADGSVELRVEKTTATDIECKVIVGGQISSHKGITLPTSNLGVPALTKKDITDLEFGVGHRVDYVALSFVRSVNDIKPAKDLLTKHKADTPIIAKIEKHEALKTIDDIIDSVDGLMVARGDLGVEIPLQEVPLAQKMLIRKANAACKPIITATQMLKSMVDNPRPTRAEVADVANAILDGTDAIMLSEETAVGQYPVEAVTTMSKIAEEIESSGEFCQAMHSRNMAIKQSVPDAISHSACTIAEALRARAIITPTFSGRTARLVSRYRPTQTIIAMSPRKEMVQRLSLVWGVIAFHEADLGSTEEIVARGKELAEQTGLVRKGDTVVITAGVPVGISGTTNLIKVDEIGRTGTGLLATGP